MPRKRKQPEDTASEPKLTEETQFTAMVIAMAVRNAMEDFHCQHLSDAQMRELNPIIRNAICTALYAMNNYAVSEKAKHYLDFQAQLIPDYWEQPKLIEIFREDVPALHSEIVSAYGRQFRRLPSKSRLRRGFFFFA